MKLALFDLDHTLIPFDSGQAWTRFLVERGVLGPDAEDRYLGFCHQYVAGTLDIHAMVRGNLLPLLQHPVARLRGWALEFESAIEPRVPADMRDLLEKHRAAGDLCAIVTATERLIAEPFARLLGVAHLLATEGEIRAGHYTGEIVGLPCFRGHKITRVQRWLATREPGANRLEDFEDCVFYSDSISDLPLLQAVNRPVAVRPDDRLRSHALQAGWPII